MRSVANRPFIQCWYAGCRGTVKYTLPLKPVGVTLCPGANTKNKFLSKLTHPFGNLDCFSAMQKFTVR